MAPPSGTVERTCNALIGLRRLLCLVLMLLGLFALPTSAQDKPLVIPQVEGGKLGRIVGRAIACGAPEERTGAVLRAARERMRAAVGQAFTEDRFLPELDRALRFETSLPKPSDAACEKALAELGRLEPSG